MNSQLPLRLRKKMEKWEKTVRRDIPKDFQIDAVIGAGKGINHTQLIIGGFIGTVILTVILNIIFGAMGLPVLISIILAGILVGLSVHLLPVFGLYQQVLLVWNSTELLVVERGAFDKLVEVKKYPRPVPGGISWVKGVSLLIDEQVIHLDDPAMCKALIDRELIGR